jgi:hypothetical protein
MRPVVDVSALIETQPIGRFAWNLLGWTFVCMLLDGFDFAGISFVVPAVAREWQVEVGSFGSVLGVGVFGLMVDLLRLGRRSHRPQEDHHSGLLAVRRLHAGVHLGAVGDRADGVALPGRRRPVRVGAECHRAGQ